MLYNYTTIAVQRRLHQKGIPFCHAYKSKLGACMVPKTAYFSVCYITQCCVADIGVQVSFETLFYFLRHGRLCSPGMERRRLFIF